jgi:hypothetical protein
MKSIKVDLYGEIKKKTLDEILKIEEPIIKRRLSLPDIILGNYTKYNELKKINKRINEDIYKLIDIKNNIIIYHRETYKKEIEKLIELIEDYQYKKKLII